ncbi:hypothetical protein [Flavobacterium urumqiense]|uniref:PLD-like domain-containing protein n=1 Tax=Flavobacterium urumqiense TaxID=935224 RepID=A0A1H6AH86_9FLAO|nr:hypothetical protein [Flavobacterium urumqiense]SEG47752.1 hypothetical protein SAMN04488130_11611 [Flavobacterium urumqiense]
MKFLKPNSVSGEIMNLLDEAKEKVIIVSPYCKFDKWYKLVKKLKDLQSRNIEIEFYIRDNEPETLEQVLKIGIVPICIPNLHAKVYLNEKTAIVTSMNLLLSSEINSLDLGYMTSTKEEYLELIDFYETYLKRNFLSSNDDNHNDDWKDRLLNLLRDKFKKINAFEDENKIFFKTSSNNYEVFISNEYQRNTLRMTGIISGSEYEYANSIADELDKNNLVFEIMRGRNRHYDSIWATLDINLKASNINDVNNIESRNVVNAVVDYISQIEEIKEYCYKNR